MAKKNDETQAGGNASRGAGALRAVRDKIDKLDLQILRLINERAGHAGEIGRLNLGCVTSAFYQILPPILDRFRAKYPEVGLSLREVDTADTNPGGSRSPGKFRRSSPRSAWPASARWSRSAPCRRTGTLSRTRPSA